MKWLQQKVFHSKFICLKSLTDKSFNICKKVLMTWSSFHCLRFIKSVKSDCKRLVIDFMRWIMMTFKSCKFSLFLFSVYDLSESITCSMLTDQKSQSVTSVLVNFTYQSWLNCLCSRKFCCNQDVCDIMQVSCV